MWRFITLSVVATGLSSSVSASTVAVRSNARGLNERPLQQAVEADLAGDTIGRSAILRDAIQENPADATLRWQAGFVRDAHGDWCTIEQSCQREEANADLAAYREERDQLGDALADHLNAARWCMRHDLPLQERFHWLAVLEQDPANELARKRLRFGNYGGQLLTHEQAADLRLEYRSRQRDIDKWRPRVKRWLKDLKSDDTYRRMNAMDAVRNVRDPAAIPALVRVFHVAGDWQREWRFVRAHGRDDAEHVARRAAVALVEAMGNIPHHDATLVLVDQAVMSPWTEVRQAATDRLARRRVTDFVPMLIGNMHIVDQSTYGEGSRMGGGTRGGHLSVETADATYQLGYQRWTSSLTATEAGISASEVAKDEADVSMLESISRAWFARAQLLNPRIHAILTHVGGEAYTRDPRVCWDAWRDYNELSKPEDKPAYSFSATVARYAPETCECFVAGTPVWTLTGPQDIETIVAGDHVLAQDPTTGELTYKAVLDTTYREPNPTVRIHIGDETIVTTRGHRFWESGYGWRMAKFLESDMRLFTTSGSLDIEHIEEGEEEPAFNLVVEDFHTYFVGQSRVLVHDNGCPKPTLAVLPGWTPPSRDQVQRERTPRTPKRAED